MFLLIFSKRWLEIPVMSIAHSSESRGFCKIWFYYSKYGISAVMYGAIARNIHICLPPTPKSYINKALSNNQHTNKGVLIKYNGNSANIVRNTHVKTYIKIVMEMSSTGIP